MKHCLPFQPDRASAASQQIEVTQNGRPTIFLVNEFRKEDMQRRPEWIQCKVPQIFGECKDGKCYTE